MWHTCNICKMNICKDLIQPTGFHLLEVFLAFFLLLWVIVGHIGGVAPEQVGGIDSAKHILPSPHDPLPKLKKTPQPLIVGVVARYHLVVFSHLHHHHLLEQACVTIIFHQYFMIWEYWLLWNIHQYESIGFIATLSMHFLPPFTSSSWAAAFCKMTIINHHLVSFKNQSLLCRSTCRVFE